MSAWRRWRLFPSHFEEPGQVVQLRTPPFLGEAAVGVDEGELGSVLGLNKDYLWGL